jgi:hypothetical protein
MTVDSSFTDLLVQCNRDEEVYDYMSDIPKTVARRLLFALSCAGFAISVGCSYLESDADMDDDRQPGLVGGWQKDTVGKCSKHYPDYLEFRETGTYAGRGAEDQFIQPIWDAGEYALLPENLVRISTANDAEILYQVEIFSDRLVFLDDQGCEFEYRRVL